MSATYRPIPIVVFSASLAACMFCNTAPTCAKPPKLGKGLFVAKVEKVRGALLQKRAFRWLPVVESQKILAGSRLISFPNSTLQSTNGAVELLMVSDIGKRGIYPVLETGVTLRKAKGVDLDLHFERGLILLKNKRKKGAAKVRLQVRDTTGVLTMSEPGTHVLLELYSRHKPGLPKLLDLKTKGPESHLILLMLKGKAFVQYDKTGFGLTAPPGPALVFWDSEHTTPNVQRLKKMPEEVEPASPDEKKLMDQVTTCISCVMTEKVRPALDKLVKSENKVDRLVAVTMLGAVDFVPDLLSAVGDGKHSDVRDHAVTVLRHWMGRQKGQVAKLYLTLTKKHGYSRAQALTFVQLLFGFDAKQRANPQVYQLLIHNLQHSKIGVRQMAHWHLVRLVPDGKTIAYDPAAGKEKRAAATRQWQRLIPEGKLPAKSGSSKKKK